MKHRVLHFGIGILALLVTGPPAQGEPDRRPIPKPVHTAPAPMAPLVPAVIDDTLTIGGEDIEARRQRTRMTVAVQVDGTGPYRFVVDSGADSSVIGTRIARTLNLPAGSNVTLNAMTGSSIVPRVLVGELALGTSRVSDLELPVLSENDLGGEGMLGIDALAEQRLMLDFEKRTINVEDARRPAPRMDGEIVVTARRRNGQLILTQVKANDRGIEAVIDTGSEITIGNMALRDQIIRRRSATIETIEVTGVTGVTVPLEIAVVREVRLGSIILHNVPIAFADVPPFAVFGLSNQPSLLLGTDLMATFRRVSLDFRARKVRFQLRRCEATGIRINSTSTSITSRLGVEKGRGEACKR